MFPMLTAPQLNWATVTLPMVIAVVPPAYQGALHMVVLADQVLRILGQGEYASAGQ